MKITKIELILCREVEDGWRPSFCRIHTDAGLYGDGEAALSYGGTQLAAFGMLQDLALLLIGRDPMEHEACWRALYEGCFFARGGGPVVYGALSALDLALWDLKGKAYGEPVYRLLGGAQRTRLACYASQLQNGWGEGRHPARTPQDYAEVVREARERGFGAVKINFLTFRPDSGRYAGTQQRPLLSPEYEKVLQQRLEAARGALGDGGLILENHCYTDRLSAVQFGLLAKPFGILYYEEPAAPQPRTLHEIYEKTGIPVASGERIFTRAQFLPYLEQNAIQVLQPDLGTCGGLTEVKKLCDLAALYEAGVQIHVCGSPLLTAASLHLEAAISNFVLHEYNVNTQMPRMRALTTWDGQPEDGALSLPEGPGFGCEIAARAFLEGSVVCID